MKDQGLFSINEIPEGFDLTDNQYKIYCGVKKNAPIISDNFEDLIHSVNWPVYYLDFETVKTAIPIYANVAPHTQIPTQYSIHKCSDFGKIDEHYEYIYSDPSIDCRRELAEKLINDLGKDGSIVTYSNFEATRIKDLMKLFPDLEQELSALIDRIVDLKKILTDGIYHPDFHGSYSIKDTLPAIVPDMSYEGLAISKGDDACAIFAYMVQGKYSEEETKKKLLEYCQQDTLAMVRLHEKLRLYI